MGNSTDAIAATADAAPLEMLRVWWIPQIPGTMFVEPVDSLKQGVWLMRVLADYDEFQFKNNIKPDYCNAGGISRLEPGCDPADADSWCDWYDEETGEDDPEKFLASQEALNATSK